MMSKEVEEENKKVVRKKKKDEQFERDKNGYNIQQKKSLL